MRTVPDNNECVIVVRCVQCASLIDCGPFTADQFAILAEGGLHELMLSSTLCGGCIGRMLAASS